MSPTAGRIDRTTVDTRAAAAIEAAEARAWADCYAAAPAGFARSAGVGFRTVADALVIHWAATGRRYFSRVIGLGVSEPASEAAIDEILAGFREAGIDMFLLQSLPHCRPGEYEGWLRDCGLEVFDHQDWRWRGGARDAGSPPRGARRRLQVEPVDADTSDEWAEFLQRAYQLDTAD